jgi:hypothetical protein
MLNDSDESDATRLVDVVDVVDGRLGPAAGCFDGLGVVGGEVEVAGWVDAGVSFVA